MKNKATVSDLIVFFFDKTVRLWSLFLFLTVLFQYFFNSKTITIPNNIFYITGLISMISALLLFCKSKKVS
ncbi:hypothetical protein FQS96_14280 [Enterococcus faecalis]|nr:hypothetical protein [Enterococcus faecalis]